MNTNFPYSEDSQVDASDGRVTGIRHSIASIIRPFKKIAATSEGETMLKFQLTIVVLLVSCFMLFWNISYYSPWEDEAVTAMAAKGIVRTGDTYAMVDGNLAAPANGATLNSKLRDRVTPMLPAYATALSFRFFGENMQGARVPFALAGLLTVALLLRWAAKEGIRHMLLVSILMIGNASFFLFFRQCQYYGFVMLFALLVFYLYWHWDGKRKKAVFLALALLGLMFSYYPACVGVAVALALDYILWRRKEVSIKRNDWLIILVPQLAGALVVCLFWNPHSTPHGDLAGNNVFGVFKLFFLTIRDLNRSEFYSAFLMIIALGLAWYYKRKNIGRMVLAVLVILFMTCVMAGTPAGLARIGDARFAPAIIALCLLVEARGIDMLCGGKTLACAIVAFLAAFSNFGNGGMFFQEGVRSTSYLYLRELARPTNADPFRPAADWINKNIPTGALVYVVPNTSAYPLMFLANRVFYSWQLDDRSQAQFKDIPPVFVRGESTPDFVIVFGPRVQEANALVTKYAPPNTHYREAAKLDVYANALFRPELISRAFLPLSGFGDDQKIRIYKRDGFDPAQIPYNPALRPPSKTPAPVNSNKAPDAATKDPKQ